MMDALSEALHTVRMTGAIFVDAICTAPWGFTVPGMERVAHILAPGTERSVGYHLVTEGNARVALEGAADVAISAGDIVVFPHGDPHTVTNGRPTELIDSGAAVGKWLAGDLTTLRAGADGGGEVTRFVCGYFGCERHAARLFLAGLPCLIKISVRSDGAGESAGELGAGICSMTRRRGGRVRNRSCWPRWPKPSSSRPCGVT